MIYAYDQNVMSFALNLAESYLGYASPNPTVGCAVAHGGDIISYGVTALCGGPHAEFQALNGLSVDDSQGSDVYITLEPCAHYGKTPPCVNLLVEKKVKRVIIAMVDPDVRVFGKGIAFLKEKGVEVCLLPSQRARDLHEAFCYKCLHHLPFVALKTATTLDGKIATYTGNSFWVTGKSSRDYGHFLRAFYDGILIGTNSVLLDNPRLNCRFLGLEDYSCMRIVFDRWAKISKNAKIFQSIGTIGTIGKKHPRIIVFSEKLYTFCLEGVEQVIVKDMYSQLEHILKILAKNYGVNRLLVEGGAQLLTTFLKQGLYNKIYHFQSPKIVGQEGLSSIGNLNIRNFDNTIELEKIGQRYLGKDICQIFRKKESVVSCLQD